MKKVLLSVNPKWVAKICNKVGERDGEPIYEKRVEVRKTRPKRETPFKVYIYCTKDNNYSFCTDDGYQYTHLGNGKVIGEFVCDRIEDFYCCSVPYRETNNLGYGRFISNGVYKVKGYNEGIVFERNDKYLDSMLRNSDLENMCLSAQELFDYIGIGKHLYAWHISDLVIYDEPRALSEFYTICPEFDKDDPLCEGCDYEHTEYSGADCPPYFECKCEGRKPIKRPPQSWCYVEEMEC